MSRNNRTIILVCAVACCAIAAGCSKPLQAIPTGEWTGTGTYVNYENKRGESGEPASRDESAGYRTTLQVSAGELYGRAALRFEVRSMRGKLMNLEGEESHVTFTLAEVKSLPNGSKLYALVEFELNPSSSKAVSQEEFQDLVKWASATAIQQGNDIVLEVLYVGPTQDEPNCFWDTFTFQRDRVLKAGRVLQAKDQENGKPDQLMWVTWSEVLRKVK